MKNSAVSLMKAKGVVTILPEFVDPVKIDLSIRGNVFFDPTRTGSDESSVQSTIVTYINSYLYNSFSTSFDFPRFSVGLTQLDNGIVGETLLVYMEKEIEYSGSPIVSFTVPTRNALADSGGLPGTVIQTPSPFFRMKDGEQQLVYMIDDGYGGLRLYREGTGELVDEVGSVNYDNGNIHVDNLNAIQSFIIEARPKANTVLAVGATLLTTKDGGVELVSI
jgi:hypothetical protein